MFGGSKKAARRNLVDHSPIDNGSSMKVLPPDQQQRLKEPEEKVVKEEELEELRRSSARAFDQGLGPDSRNSLSAEELARIAAADLEEVRLHEEEARLQALREQREADERAALEQERAAEEARLQQEAIANEKARVEVIASIFRELDRDSSGGVSVVELVKAMRKDDTLACTLGLTDRKLRQNDGTIDKIAALFFKHDSDQGGELDLTEFTRMIESAPTFVVPISMKDHADKAHYHGEIADDFDIAKFAKGVIRGVLIANGERPEEKASDENADSESDAEKANNGPSPERHLDGASDVASLALKGDKNAETQIFAYLDRDGSGTISVREMILGVKREPALARTLGLGEGKVDQNQLVEMFSKWDENGDRELDREEFAAIFGSSIAAAQEQEEAQRIADDAIILARQVSEEQALREEEAERERVAGERLAEKQEIARLRNELNDMKIKLEPYTKEPNLRKTGSTRRRIRRLSPGSRLSPMKTGDGSFDAGYTSGGSGPGSGNNKKPKSNQKPEWHSPSYSSYLNSPEFKKLGIAEAIEYSREHSKPTMINGYWREPLNMTALRKNEVKTKVTAVVTEEVPIAAYKETWKSGLRNGDITKYRDQKPRPMGSPSPHGFEPAGYKNASSITQVMSDITALSPGSYFGGGKRMFSRAFQRHYLNPTPGVDPQNPTVDPPGVKVSHEDMVGVYGTKQPSRHKEDLKHRGSVQPLSFHRNVVGDVATTHTSTAPGELTQYPKSERTKKDRVWVPG